MLQAILMKKVISVVMEKIAKKHRIKKLQDYVEKDNELDIQVKQQQKTIGRQGKTIEENEKEIAIMKNEISALKEIAHAPQEYVCCKNCGCKIAKIKNK
tara:strand:+ start:792 stop:1088 length:297 start_codon:yes stop_codon:yes gene_type:complete